MISNKTWILIGKKLSGEATAEELIELELLLKQESVDAYPLLLLEAIWRNNPNDPGELSLQLEEKWKSFEAKLEKNESSKEPQIEDVAKINSGNQYQKHAKKTLKWASLFAACVIILLGSFWFLNTNNTVQNNKTNEIIAPKGGMSKVQLPDGTMVWLNSGSKLVYRTNFGSEFRAVSLIGEGFFDVVKDPDHPFIVTTATIRIKVLGTTFNVRAYANDKTSETTLLLGQIELTVLKNPGKGIILKPMEKLIVKNDIPLDTISRSKKDVTRSKNIPLISLNTINLNAEDSLPAEAQWMENKLAFDAEEFEDLAKKMERKYNISIIFENEEVKKFKFTGVFQNEPVNTALKNLQAVAYFHFKINNDEIIIK